MKETARSLRRFRCGAAIIARTLGVGMGCFGASFLSGGQARAQSGTTAAPEAQTVAAQEAPSVEALVALAVSRFPSVAALRARLASAREQVSPSGALPDPMVGLMYQSVGAPWAPMAPMTMGQIEVTQAIPYPGKRQARRDAASAETLMRAAEITELTRRITMEVRTTYARIYALDKERESVEAARQFTELLAATVTSRYTTGQTDQEALIKVDLERFRLDERRADLVAERAGLVAALNRLTDQPGGAPFGRIAAIPDVSVPTERVEVDALANAPEIAVERAAITAAERRLEAARIEKKPNFIVGLAGGATADPAAIFTFRFGMELPVWSGDKQEPLVRAAHHDLEAATDGLHAAEAGIRAEAARLRAQSERDASQITRYREAIIPQTAVALEAARSAYLTGRGDFTTVVEDFRLWLDARMGLARREADRFATWAEMQALTERATNASP